MPTIADIAICIRHWDYSETSQTVSLFSREHGVIRGLAKGSRREKANFSGGIDLFALGECRAIMKSGSELANLIEWTLVDAHWALRDTLRAHRRALYFADLVHHLVRDHDPHVALFDSFAAALSKLGNESTVEVVTAEFLWSALCEAGYRPVVDRDAATGRAFAGDDPLAFDTGAGGVVIATPGLENWRIRLETHAVLQRLSNQKEMPTPSDISPEAARRAACLLSAYIRTILGYEPATLRWVFPELTERK